MRYKLIFSVPVVCCLIVFALLSSCSLIKNEDKEMDIFRQQVRNQLRLSCELKYDMSPSELQAIYNKDLWGNPYHIYIEPGTQAKEEHIEFAKNIYWGPEDEDAETYATDLAKDIYNEDDRIYLIVSAGPDGIFQNEYDNYMTVGGAQAYDDIALSDHWKRDGHRDGPHIFFNEKIAGSEDECFP